MEQLGKKFKQKREERDISLTEARENTNIRLDYLQAIEEGEFEKISEEVYLKGFLKVYSNYLNLDTQEIMEEYKEIKAVKEKEAAEEEKKGEEREVSAEKLSFKEQLKRFKEEHENLLLAVFIGGLLLLLAAGGFYLGRAAYNQFKKYNVGEKVGEYITEVKSSLNNEEESDSGTEVQSQSETETEEGLSRGDGSSQLEELQQESKGNEEGLNEEEPQNLEQTSNQNKDEEVGIGDEEEISATEEGNNITSPENDKTNNEQPQESSLQEEISIKIETIEESWYSVEIDGEPIFKGTLSKGVTKSFSGEEIRVKIGNAAGVQIVKGGETLGPFGKKGEVITKVFSSQDEVEEE